MAAEFRLRLVRYCFAARHAVRHAACRWHCTPVRSRCAYTLPNNQPVIRLLNASLKPHRIENRRRYGIFTTRLTASIW